MVTGKNTHGYQTTFTSILNTEHQGATKSVENSSEDCVWMERSKGKQELYTDIFLGKDHGALFPKGE